MSSSTHTKWETVERGIRKYDHLTRKNGLKPDTYFALRYKIDGKRYEEGLGWASEGMTLAKAREVLAGLRLAKATGQGEVTLAEKRERTAKEKEAERNKPTIALLWEIYNEAHKERASRNSDISAMKHILPYFANKIPDEIRTAHVDNLRRELEKAGKSPQTVKHVLELLRRVIRYGAQRGLCDMPNTSKLYFDMPKVDNEKTECLTPEQFHSLMGALDREPDQHLANLMRLALATGMRKGALFGLQWQDIDFGKGVITLRGEEAKKGRTEYLPMTTAARTILMKVEQTASPYVFYGKNGKKRVDIKRFLDRIKREANLPADFRPLHGLRHTYASWLASSGEVTLLELQKLMTHESPAMTMRYAHLADKSLRKAANVIDTCLAEAVNAPPAQAPQKAKVTTFSK